MPRISLNYAQKLFLLATVPLVLAAAAISLVVAVQSSQLAKREIRELEVQLIEAKKRELKNYLTLARNAFFSIYGRATPDDEEAKTRVMQILAAMTYGQDGSFFVYDYDGINLVSPRQTEFINQNWAGLSDPEGVPVVDELIRIARSGAGYHTYLWEKPSTGEQAQMVTYVIGLQNWRWAVGTGIFIDDVRATVANAQAETEARIARTFIWIGVITVGALLMVFCSGLLLNIRERRLADAKLKALTTRIIDTQEEERGRVARELHDSVSQMLIGVRYTLELAKRRMTAGDARASANLERGIDGLSGSIQEVRRISRDLRPGVLDDLGLGPALQTLTEAFGKRTGITSQFDTVVFRNRLDPDAKIALYRIAQEALTNIERHSEATDVFLKVWGHARGATLLIRDNGKGIDGANGRIGLGLRNMQERIEQLDGRLDIKSGRDGTIIQAHVPLSHLLPPEEAARPSKARPASAGGEDSNERYAS
ncbi:cache domain-containing protein [Actibacterium sp. 188UL27-1]|nr:cache domain-containing protein [Actibacterium sp. 188UL27-1]